ncbi:hypothetical protein GCM10009578_014980 [Streptomyces rhizosphaericus]
MASTANPAWVPSCRMAAMPSGMESCRKPAVLENTSTRPAFGRLRTGAAHAGAFAAVIRTAPAAAFITERRGAGPGTGRSGRFLCTGNLRGEV